MGHTLLMGRRTFESLEGRQLPGRRIIVLSKSLQEAPPGADNLAQDLTKGLRLAQFKYKDTEAFIAGGAQVYSVALEDDLVDRMYLTLVETSVPADTYLPQFDHENWELVESEQHEADERNPFGYTFQVLERVSQRLAA